MGHFKWKVPTKGYYWSLDDNDAEGLTKDHQPQTDHQSDGSGNDDEMDLVAERKARLLLRPILYEFREYEPFEKPGLFRTFAAVDPTEESILGFANKYGHLGDVEEFPEDVQAPRYLHPELDADAIEVLDERERSMPTRDWYREQRFYYSLPETMWSWTTSIGLMRRCVDKWSQFHGKAIDGSEAKDLIDEINEQLVFEVELMVRARKRSPKLFEIEYVPRHLLAALWIQMAEAITEDKSLRQCPGCGEWFEWSTQQYRKSKRYCSDPCKSQAFRNRKIKAVQMAEAGRSPKEIAEHLHTQVKFVEKWLKRK